MRKIRTELVVVGGGVAGSMAALAAARNGVEVTLVEKYGFLGGMATAGLVGPMMTFHAEEEQIIKGIPQELIERLQGMGGSPGHVYDMIGFVSTLTPVDTEKLKIVLEEMLLESGVKIIYHSAVIDIQKENESITCVIVRSRLEEYKVFGEVFIDSTGDGELIALAEAPFQIGRFKDQKTQPMSLMFQIGGVDFDLVRKAVAGNPTDFLLSKPRHGKKPSEFPYLAVNGFFSVIEEAKAQEDFPIPRDRVLFFQQPISGVVTVNMTRIIDKDPLIGEDLTYAEINARKQMLEIIAFMKKYLPGFKSAYLSRAATQIGIRESRRLVGEYTLTGEDIVNGRKFETAISRGAFPIDIHSPDGSKMEIIYMKEGSWYHIPREATITKKVPNLMVAGRNISTTHEAHASTRVQPSVMGIGQGVGTNAALAIKNKQFPFETNIEELQAQLRRDNAVI